MPHRGMTRRGVSLGFRVVAMLETGSCFHQVKAVALFRAGSGTHPFCDSDSGMSHTRGNSIACFLKGRVLLYAGPPKPLA